eukprot:scaffold19504_cov72-Skeletonema_dohrnii-CCMP3373.AAC.1
MSRRTKPGRRRLILVANRRSRGEGIVASEKYWTKYWRKTRSPARKRSLAKMKTGRCVRSRWP